MAASAMRCQSWSCPLIARPAISARATPRAASAATRIERRSSRSLATPPTSRNTIVGTVIAMPTTDSAVGASDSAYTCHASATRKAPSPSNDTQVAPHSRRKSRWRSGASRPVRLTPPVRSSASWLWCIGRRDGRHVLGEEREARVGIHRAGEEEALAELAPQLVQRLPLLGELDPFGDDLQTERRAERDDRGREPIRLRSGALPQERAVH